MSKGHTILCQKDTQYYVKRTDNTMSKGQTILHFLCQKDRQNYVKWTDNAMSKGQTIICQTDRQYYVKRADNTMSKGNTILCQKDTQYYVKRTDNTMSKRHTILCQKDTQYYVKRTDNTMSRGQTMIYTTLHIKLKTEHDEPYKNIVVKSRALEGYLQSSSCSTSGTCRLTIVRTRSIILHIPHNICTATSNTYELLL